MTERSAGERAERRILVAATVVGWLGAIAVIAVVRALFLP
jgi:hypothetical protein